MKIRLFGYKLHINLTAPGEFGYLFRSRQRKLVDWLIVMAAPLNEGIANIGWNPKQRPGYQTPEEIAAILAKKIAEAEFEAYMEESARNLADAIAKRRAQGEAALDQVTPGRPTEKDAPRNPRTIANHPPVDGAFKNQQPQNMSAPRDRMTDAELGAARTGLEKAAQHGSGETTTEAKFKREKSNGGDAEDES